MKFKRLEKFLKEKNIDFRKNESIKNHTSFRIGGKVKIFVKVKNFRDLRLVMDGCELYKIKYYILGNGTNVLFSDVFHKIVVIKLCFKKIRRTNNIVIAGAGVNIFALNLFAVGQNLSGLEWSYGIPGTVGGAVYMNAGSFGGETSDCLKWVKVLDNKNEIIILEKNNLKFDYRFSSFQKNGNIILEAAFELIEDDGEKIWRKCLENFNIRKEKQPYDKYNAGSIFKRQGDVIAAKLIEECGFKGYKVGGAMVSRKHCGFIVNEDNATFYDVLKIIYEIKRTVYKKFAIMLEEEVEIIGKRTRFFRRLPYTHHIQQKEMVSKKTRQGNT